jgi:hypothetical protein
MSAGLIEEYSLRELIQVSTIVVTDATFNVMKYSIKNTVYKTITQLQSNPLQWAGCAARIE